MLKTPHRILGTKKDGRWRIIAKSGPYVAQATASGSKAGFKDALAKARERLGAKMREN
jgi:hypothetical protein